MNNDELEKIKELPVGGEADVIVFGSDPAGISASIAARRHGAKVILLERFFFQALA